MAYVSRCQDRNLDEYIKECATELNEIETFPRKEEVSVSTDHKIKANEIKQIKDKEEVFVSTVPIIEENEIKQIEDNKKLIPNMPSHVVEFDHVKRPERHNKISESHHIRDFTGHSLVYGNIMFKSSPTVQFRSSVMAPSHYNTYNIFYTYPMLSNIPLYRNPQPPINRII